MSFNFEMIGKISMPKATDKFNPYTETVFDSGWMRKRLLFNVSSGDNRHMLCVEEGAWKDESKWKDSFVYTFTKGTTDADGNKVKGENIKIPFKDRLTTNRIDEIAEFKKFVIDLEENGRRINLQKLSDKIKDGDTLTAEELAGVGVESEDQINDALEKSKKKRHEFISMWDYIDYIKKVLESDKYKNKKFYIKGAANYSYSDKNEKFYENLVPTRIYLAADDAEEYSIATVNVLFGADSLDDMSVDEKDKYYINGWHMEYDSNRKKNLPVEITVVIPAEKDGDEKAKKKVQAIKKKFVVDGDEIKEYGVQINMLNGAQKVEIDESMLTDEQKEDLEAGLIELDDIRAELGGSVYGDKVQEYVFVKPARGFTKGAQETSYTVEDMTVPSIEDEARDIVESLFDDEDDDL